MHAGAVAVMSRFAALLLGLIVGIVLGYQSAHKTVAAECIRLGAFFVGEQDFICGLKATLPEATTEKDNINES